MLECFSAVSFGTKTLFQKLLGLKLAISCQKKLITNIFEGHLRSTCTQATRLLSGTVLYLHFEPMFLGYYQSNSVRLSLCCGWIQWLWLRLMLRCCCCQTGFTFFHEILNQTLIGKPFEYVSSECRISNAIRGNSVISLRCLLWADMFLVRGCNPEKDNSSISESKTCRRKIWTFRAVTPNKCIQKLIKLIWRNDRALLLPQQNMDNLTIVCDSFGG